MYKYQKLHFMSFYINICHKITMHVILYVIKNYILCHE